MDKENKYIYIEMQNFDKMKNIIEDEFNKKINSEKYQICSHTGFQNKKKNRNKKKCKINNFRTTFTGSFNF